MMEKVRKLKPIAARITQFNGSITEARAGTASAIAAWQTTLSPLHHQDGIVMVAGVLLDKDGRATDCINLNLPLSAWPQVAPVGRPKEDEKRLAVLLAWALQLHRMKNRKGDAYKSVSECKYFHCVDDGKVRRDCKQAAEQHGIAWPLPINGPQLLQMPAAEVDGNGDSACLIDKLRWVKTDEESCLYGIGYVWHERFKCRVFAGSVAISLPHTERDSDFEYLKQRYAEGPIIISLFRAGRK